MKRLSNKFTSECEICKSIIESTEKRNCSVCSFIACKSCIETWFNTSLKCPQCREEESWEYVEYGYNPPSEHEISAHLVQRIGELIEENEEEFRNTSDFNDLIQRLIRTVGEELSEELEELIPSITSSMTIFVQQQQPRRENLRRRMWRRIRPRWF